MAEAPPAPKELSAKQAKVMLRTFYYSSLTTYYLLLTTYYSLLTTYYLQPLPTAYAAPLLGDGSVAHDAELVAEREHLSSK